jgi:hypothetical protein
MELILLQKTKQNMKKTLAFGIVSAMLIFITSCSHPSSAVGSNTYTFKGTTYHPTVIVQSSSSLQSSDYSASSVILVFTTFPTVSGTYQISSSTGPSSPNQIAVNFANLTTSATYHGQPSGTINATVTVASNGKITVVIPSVTLTNGAGDTGSFTANLTQQ